MKSLTELQTQFQAYILQKDQTITAEISSAENVDNLQRLCIYRNGYYQRLINALSRDYSILAQYIGYDEFEELARNYIDAYPSTSYSVMLVGRHFVEYLASCSSCPLLWRELASFEDAFNQAMLAPEAQELSLENLTALTPDDWPQLKFNFHHSVTTINCQYPISELWTALQANADVSQELVPQMSAYIIWRRGQMSFYSPLSQAQYTLACEIEAHNDFATICGRLSETYGDDLNWVAETIREWVAEGIFQVDN